MHAGSRRRAGGLLRHQLLLIRGAGAGRLGGGASRMAVDLTRRIHGQSRRCHASVRSATCPCCWPRAWSAAPSCMRPNHARGTERVARRGRVPDPARRRSSPSPVGCSSASAAFPCWSPLVPAQDRSAVAVRRHRRPVGRTGGRCERAARPRRLRGVPAGARDPARRRRSDPHVEARDPVPVDPLRVGSHWWQWSP